jgi:flavin reductase (DIM6/NTAB) family NADH-FMN oxidoreductase RutF
MAKIQIRPGNHLFPLPPCLITCGPADRPNIITLAWVGSLCSEPPIMGVSIRPSRYSHPLVTQAGEFGLNVPSVSLLRAVDYCGSVSGRDVDKFTAMGLTPAPAHVIRTALIAECPLNLECQVVQTVSLGSHDLFLGKVVAVHVDDTLLNTQGEIDLGRANSIAYGSRTYWSLGQQLERQGFARPR